MRIEQMQTHHSSNDAFRQRYVVGNAFEKALTEHYEAMGAKVLCPVLNNEDQAIAGEAGYFINNEKRSGLNRRFLPVAEVPPAERDRHSPAFMLPTGPVIAPDFRIEQNGKIRFVEAKTRPYAHRAEIRGSLRPVGVIGWRSVYVNSYEALIAAGVDLSIDLLLYWPSFYDKAGRPRHAATSWGFYKFPPHYLADKFQSGPSNFKAKDTKFIEMRYGKRQKRDVGLALARRTVQLIKREGVDPFERRTGSDHFVG